MDANFDDFLEEMFGERPEPVQEGQQIVGQGPVDDDLLKELFGERPEPRQEGQQFIDLDSQVPYLVRLPADEWVEILNDAKDEFEVDGATAVFSTWRVEGEDPLTLVILRSLTSCMQEPADWPSMLAWQMRGQHGYLSLF